MGLRREAIVLIASAAVLGLLLWTSGDAPTALRGRSRSAAPELPEVAVPELDRVRPADLRGGERGGAPRDLFAPPSDTRPLPPLEWEEPPREPLAGLAPPALWGPAPRSFADWLRADAEPRPYDGLFRSADELALELELADAAAELDPADEDAPTSVVVGDEGVVAGDEGRRETPAERAARIQSYKQLYDWIQLTSLKTLFGSIRNLDRYALRRPERAAEAVLFVQVDPETGRELFGGAAPVAYERDRIAEFGLADTATNRIVLELPESEGKLTRGTYPQVLGFAAECLASRLEAPRALEIARHLYGVLADFDPEDPAPRLGLALCHEAAFDFEAAFDEYARLLERFPHRSEVWVQLADLEARCLMDASAERRLERALELERSAWRVHWALGRFLLERGRTDEALERLEDANRFAPDDSQRADQRLAMQVDLGHARLAAGRVAEARDLYARVLRAVPEDASARAGELSCRALLAREGGVRGGSGRTGGDALAAGVGGAADGAAPPAELEPEGGADFELLLAAGLWALATDDAEAARDRLLDAVDADALRAPVAWRTLSWLAETRGYPDEALRYAELACEGDPTDAYALFQRGRLLADADDIEGARESFRAALERELDFPDALIALGELAFRTGDADSAERYLVRALPLAGERPELFELRGLNLLRGGSLLEATTAFDRALELDPASPVAHGGAAWCTYLLGDPEEALVQLANLDERRRGLPEEDPARVWAREQIERLRDHLEKVEWLDAFERSALRNDWTTDEGPGPRIALEDGVVAIDGVFERSGRVRVRREYPASLFVSVEARVRVSAASPVRVGLFLARERDRRGRAETQSEVSVSRHKDGGVQLQVHRSGLGGSETTDVPSVPFPADRWVVLRIERGGDAASPTVDVSVDGLPVAVEIPAAELGRAAVPLRVGVFVEGETGRRVEAEVDDVRVVYREVDR